MLVVFIIVALVLGVVFVSLAKAMRRQQDEITTPYGAIGRGTDDGAPADLREPR